MSYISSWSQKSNASAWPGKLCYVFRFTRGGKKELNQEKIPQLLLQENMERYLNAGPEGEKDMFNIAEDTILSLKYYTDNGFHVFVLIRTKEWYWTLEKHDVGITLQRSKNEDDIMLHVWDKDRTGPLINQFTSNRLYRSNYTMLNVIKWLIKNHELSRRYDLGFNNCRDFARRFIHAFCSREDDIRFGYEITVKGRGQKLAGIGFPLRILTIGFQRLYLGWN